MPPDTCDAPDTLTIKQRRFVSAYIGEADGNASKAAAMAGYGLSSVRDVGCKNLKKPAIIKAIQASGGLVKLREAFVREKSFVYFLRADNGLIKIGMTSNVTRRLYALNAGMPYDLEVLRVIETDKAEELEAELHQRFASRRVRGEWFRITKREAMRA